MSILSSGLTSHRVQLCLTAVLSASLAAGVLLGYQRAKRKALVRDIKKSIPDVSEEHIATTLTDYGAALDILAPSKEDERSAVLALRARQGDYDDELILEQLARNRVFLTDKGLAKVRSAFVIVVGCGGVGSHAAAALARSGVSRLRLIDFDQVTLSSLNRHALATLADVGTPKVMTIKRRLEAIAPWVRFDCRMELFNATTADGQLGGWQSKDDGSDADVDNNRKPDYIIDAIDNIDSKVALLHHCHTHGLPVISSMGAGCKSDPSRVFVGDISNSTDDPLSRSTRRRLRLLGVNSGIPVVYSSEKPGPGKAELLPLPDDEFAKGNVGDLSVLRDFRVRILPVLGTMPAIFGLAAANHVMLELSGYPHEYLASKMRDKMYDGIMAALLSQEERLARAAGQDCIGMRIPVGLNDVGYLVEEVYRGKSVISGLRTRLVLTRWSKPGKFIFEEKTPGQKCSLLTLSNLVCMTKEESVVHEKQILRGDKTAEEFYDNHVLDMVKSRMEEERCFEKYR